MARCWLRHRDMSGHNRQKKDGSRSEKSSRNARRRPGAAVPRWQPPGGERAEDITRDMTAAPPVRRRAMPPQAERVKGGGASARSLASSSPRGARGKAGREGKGK